MFVKPTSYSNHSKSILIVEDNDILLELLAEGFEGFGFNVIKADNGLSAWNLFNSEYVDIVLADIQMPGLDGIELSKRIRSQSPNKTIALMTGGNTEAAKELLKDETVNYLFKKPFPLSYVCKCLNEEMQMV